MEQKQIQIKAKDDDLKGVYANGMQVIHTREEFCLDFFNLFPPQGILTARVLISPAHLKRMLKVLIENLKKYEEKFGEVKVAEEPKMPIGFQP